MHMTGADDMTQKLTEAELLKKNAGLIHKFSIKFIRARPEIADDILQAARLGFITAARSHDPAKSALSTFAAMHIIREIALLFEVEQVIQLPRGYATEIRRLRKKLESELTHSERSKLFAATPPASLDMPIFADGAATTFIDIVESEAPGPEALAEHALLARKLAAAINRLAPAQRGVITSYHFDPSEPTFDEIGTARGNGRAAAHCAYKVGIKNLRRSLQHLAA